MTPEELYEQPDFESFIEWYEEQWLTYATLRHKVASYFRTTAEGYRLYRRFRADRLGSVAGFVQTLGYAQSDEVISTERLIDRLFNTPNSEIALRLCWGRVDAQELVTEPCTIQMNDMERICLTLKDQPEEYSLMAFFSKYEDAHWLLQPDGSIPPPHPAPKTG